jgi:hypothetical protein
MLATARYLVTAVIALVALGSARLHAQAVRGTVVDSASQRPLRSAIVQMEAGDRVVASARTDSLGAFAMAAPSPGIYRVRVRLVGFGILDTAPFTLGAGEIRPLRIALGASAYALDTVRAVARGGFFDVTRGSQWFAKHEREGKGLFLSGLEIVKSKRTACDFIANQPGLGFVAGSSGSPEEMAMKRGIRCIDGRYVGPSSGEGCIATQVDRWAVIVGLDSMDMWVLPSPRPPPGAGGPVGRARAVGSGGLSTPAPRRASDSPVPNGLFPPPTAVPVPFERVRGIEVYRNRTELPRDNGIPIEALIANASCMWVQVWTDIAW